MVIASTAAVQVTHWPRAVVLMITRRALIENLHSRKREAANPTALEPMRKPRTAHADVVGRAHAAGLPGLILYCW